MSRHVTITVEYPDYTVDTQMLDLKNAVSTFAWQNGSGRVIGINFDYFPARPIRGERA